MRAIQRGIVQDSFVEEGDGGLDEEVDNRNQHREDETIKKQKIEKNMLHEGIWAHHVLVINFYNTKLTKESIIQFKESLGFD